eukprot:COSAG01_NODE_19575_length_1002_cov_32.160576_2_plen_101_part_00
MPVARYRVGSQFGCGVCPETLPLCLQDNGTVIHFSNPKVQASIAANTYVISGHAETKRLQDLLPGILNQVMNARAAESAVRGCSPSCTPFWERKGHRVLS